MLNFWFATGIGIQIYRYTNISSPVQAIGIGAGPIAAGLAVLGIGLIFGPLRTRLEVWVNHHFYAHKLNLSRDFVEFLPEARATIDCSELLQILIRRTLEILHILHGEIFLKDAADRLQLAEIQNLSPQAAQSIDWAGSLKVRIEAKKRASLDGKF